MPGTTSTVLSPPFLMQVAGAFCIGPAPLQTAQLILEVNIDHVFENCLWFIGNKDLREQRAAKKLPIITAHFRYTACVLSVPNFAGGPAVLHFPFSCCQGPSFTFGLYWRLAQESGDQHDHATASTPLLTFRRAMKSINQSISLIATLRPESRIANDMQLK